MPQHPIRVRVALPRYEHPDVSRILAKLVISHFLDAVTNNGNDEILRYLIFNNIGPCIDNHLTADLARLRSHNAGAMLLSHTLNDISGDLWPGMFGAFGGKAVLGGIDPTDANIASAWFGEHDATKTAFTHIRTRSHSDHSESVSTTTGTVTQSCYSPADLTHEIPAEHAVITLTRRNGRQNPPALIGLEGQNY